MLIRNLGEGEKAASMSSITEKIPGLVKEVEGSMNREMDLGYTTCNSYDESSKASDEAFEPFYRP